MSRKRKVVAGMAAVTVGFAVYGWHVGEEHDLEQVVIPVSSPPITGQAVTTTNGFMQPHGYLGGIAAIGPYDYGTGYVNDAVERLNAAKATQPPAAIRPAPLPIVTMGARELEALRAWCNELLDQNGEG